MQTERIALGLLVALLGAGLAGCNRETRTGNVAPNAVSPSLSNALAVFSNDTSFVSTLPTNAVLEQVSPGVFRFGEVTIDRERRTVSFSAQMNFGEGAMEYFLVTTWGKLHESIFRTEVEPHRIHAAMLLLGAKGAGTNAESAVEVLGQFISQPSSERLPGDEITLEVSWQVEGRKVRRLAEELVYNAESRSALRKGTWVYNGSLLVEQTFLADHAGSIVSLITDPVALINNVAPGHDNQAIWFANSNSLPPVETPVEMTIRLKRGD